MITARQIIDSILIRLGLGQNIVADPFISSNLELKEIIELLNDKLITLSTEIEFTELKKQATFETKKPNRYKIGIIAPDLNLFSSKTFIDTTAPAALHLITDEEYSKKELFDKSFADPVFMIVGDEIWLSPNYPNGNKIKFFYYSKYTVKSANNEEKESFTAGSDTSLLPDQLLIWSVVCAWLKQKGLETYVAAEAEFNHQLNRYPITKPSR